MMRFILFPVCCFLLTVSVFAQQSAYCTRQGLVTFVSDAPLESIKASSMQLKGCLDPEKRSFSFVIPSNSFTGFDSQLQQIHFFENYIEAQKFPEAGFQGKIIEQIDLRANGEYVIRAKGGLTIHGVEQERIIKVKLNMIKGVLYATSDFTILLLEHNIVVPKVVYQKIAEEIAVHVSLELLKK